MKLNQSAFTIVELMIATAIFTIILLITTTTIVGITQTYVKGSIQSQNQDTATNVLNDISQDIEYNNPSTINTSDLYTASGPVRNAEDEYFFCVGNDVYAYTFDQPLNTSATTTPYNIGLVRYSSTSCPTSIGQGGNNSVPTTLSGMPAGYEELLVQNERVGEMYVQGETINNTETYDIALEIGYATATSNNLISDTGSYQNGQSVPAANYTYPYQCLGGINSSYCAVTNLTTTVAPRIND